MSVACVGFLLVRVMRFGVVSRRLIRGRRPWVREGRREGDPAVAVSGREVTAIVEVLEQVRIDHAVVDLVVGGWSGTVLPMGDRM